MRPRTVIWTCGKIKLATFKRTDDTYSCIVCGQSRNITPYIWLIANMIHYIIANRDEVTAEENLDYMRRLGKDKQFFGNNLEVL
jgi:hypothetical protein